MLKAKQLSIARLVLDSFMKVTTHKVAFQATRFDGRNSTYQHTTNRTQLV